MKKTFPEKFLWGAATAAHQVEGNNTHSDYWTMEKLEGTTFKEPSGDAVDHYRMYREDIALMAELGLNTYRFSIEWARIEPQEGIFNVEALDHYRVVLAACQESGITPIVTMHHFSSPKWLITVGGWESEGTPARFARYCEYVMSELGSMIPYVCTINEANISVGIAKVIKQFTAGKETFAQVGLQTDMQQRMVTYYGALGKAFGIDPRQVQHFLSPRTKRGFSLIFEAHMAARVVIRRVSPATKIGLTMSLFDIQASSGGEENAQHEHQEEFLQFIPYLKGDDFFGLQNYSSETYGPDGLMPIPEDAERTQMGYLYNPEALEQVIRYVSKHIDIPIIVTENGTATDNDERRVEFINRAISGVHACIQDGIPVQGYTHWSLLDNFEWMLGYTKTFGLIAVDRNTQKRMPKPSARHLGTIAQSNACPNEY
ncbi:family 1 glycosylhydrolase [Paenibacillus sp. FSL R10-2734]|uniref:glycoside hydrolase family 1 protein n=1 Tax=Paenibacillus sp. FSL R10-2734 TaxID=2954691 RepID=UPI0030DA1780